MVSLLNVLLEVIKDIIQKGIIVKINQLIINYPRKYGFANVGVNKFLNVK